MISQKNMGMTLIFFSILLFIILGFVKADIDSRDAFLCQAVHSNPDLEMNQCPVHEDNNSWMMIVAFGITFLILGSGLYLLFVPNKRETIDNNNNNNNKIHNGSNNHHNFKEIDTTLLSEDEKRIYLLLKEKEGSMYQSDLIKKTDFSKVQMTRILDKMEHNGIVERKRRGMTNIVVLK